MTGDRAVKRVKALPKNRNAAAPKTVYRCKSCKYRTHSIAIAWTHSAVHGPWDGNGTPLRESSSKSYTMRERSLTTKYPQLKRVK